MLKKLISICLIFVVMLQSFSRLWIIVSFKANQEYIAKVLCINRDKPEMHCNGNCILMQRMRAADEHEKEQLPQKLKEHEEAPYCNDTLIWVIEPASENPAVQPPVFYDGTLHSSEFPYGVFQPPRTLTV